jgi:competence protein ComEA
MESGEIAAAEESTLAEVRRQVRIQYRGYVVVAAVVSLIVGGFIGRFTTRETGMQVSAELTPPPYWEAACAPAAGDPDVTPSPTPTPQPVRVYVSGAVADPKVVLLPAESLVVDALDAAGGIAPDADLQSLNLAAPLEDHQHIIVPRYTPVGTAEPERGAAEEPTLLIDINTASAAELESLPKIGPTLAERIVEHRKAYGPFKRKEDLRSVSGIGANTYQEIEPYITVGP